MNNFLSASTSLYLRILVVKENINQYNKGNNSLFIFNLVSRLRDFKGERYTIIYMQLCFGSS